MVASPAVFAEKMPIKCKNVKAKILKTDSASFAILHLKGCTNSYFLFFSIGFVVFCEINCREPFLCFLALKHVTCFGCVRFQPIGVNVAVQIQTALMTSQVIETPSHACHVRTFT